MNFREAESYLLSLGNEVSAMKLGLENIRKLLGELGDPQKNYLKVQVAGTNGKGSVCAFLNAVCLAAGIETGMYTSPHLISITERIKIGGENISESEFARHATRVREASEELVKAGAFENLPTFFEQVTAVALIAFADANVELAILETGLGGRLDATTAANAEICAITRIDYDHQQYLGETLKEIAAEKAAIIHGGSEVVIAEQEPEAMAVILERCREAGVKPRLTSEMIAREAELASDPAKIRFGIPGDTRPLTFPSITLLEPNGRYRTIGLGLLGSHQIENARAAMLIADLLRSRFPITEEQLSRGLSHARHPGRLEWIGQFLLDGAHNIGGAKALRTYLDEFVTQPITMIFGAMGDKDVGEIADILFPRAHRLILTTAQNSRAIAAEDLIHYLPNEFDRTKVFVVTNATAAIGKAREISGEKDVIVASGSLYLIGEMRGLLLKTLKTD